MSSSYRPNPQAFLSMEEIIAAASKRSEEAGSKKSESSQPTTVTLRPILPFDWSSVGKDKTPSEVVTGLLAVGGGKSMVNAAVIRNYDGKSFHFNQAEDRRPMDRAMGRALLGSGMEALVDDVRVRVRCNGTREGLLKRMASNISAPRPLVSKVLPVAVRNYVVKSLPMKGVAEYPMIVPLNHPIDVKHPMFQKLNTASCSGLPYLMEWSMSSVRRQGSPNITCMTRLPAFLFTDGLKNNNTNIATQCKLVDECHAVTIIAHAAEVFRHLLVVLDGPNGMTDISTMFADYPWLNTFMLKRKEEKILRTEIKTKVRPYGVQPLPMRLLCNYANAPFDRASLSFFEHPDSVSAYRFSPFYGGASDLIRRMRGHHEDMLREREETGKGQLRQIVYGDDQILMILAPDGGMVVVCPDVKSMDMHTLSQHGARVFGVIGPYITSLSTSYKNAVRLWLNVAFNHSLHVGDSFVLAKTIGLLSGVPGTTFLNIIQSAFIGGYLRTIYEIADWKAARKLDQVEQIKFIEASLTQAFVMMESELNMTFKPTEMPPPFLCQNGWENAKNTELPIVHTMATKSGMFTAYQWCKTPSDIEKGLALPFLASVIVQTCHGGTNSHIMLPSDYTKFGGSLALPGPGMKGAREGVSETLQGMARIMGVFYTGGWAYPPLEAFLRKRYKASLEMLNSKSVGTLLADVDGALGDTDIYDAVKVITPSLPPGQLPSVDFMGCFCALTRTEVFDRFFADGATHKKTQEAVLSESSSSSSSSPSAALDTFSDMLVLTTPPTGNLGSTAFPAQNTIASAGQMSAKTRAQMVAKYERAKARWAARDAERAKKALQNQLMDFDKVTKLFGNRNMTQQEKATYKLLTQELDDSNIDGDASGIVADYEQQLYSAEDALQQALEAASSAKSEAEAAALWGERIQAVRSGPLAQFLGDMSQEWGDAEDDDE